MGSGAEGASSVVAGSTSFILISSRTTPVFFFLPAGSKIFSGAAALGFMTFFFVRLALGRAGSSSSVNLGAAGFVTLVAEAS